MKGESNGTGGFALLVLLYDYRDHRTT
jgi:hypothetical protein